MKRIIVTSISLIVFFCLLSVANNVLCVKTEAGVTQSRALYDQPKNTIDVVMLGSSHVHCGINTARLFTDYGIAGYDLSSAEQPLHVSYHYLKELCKYQKPKVVVLDFFTAAAFQEDYKYHYYFLGDSLYGMRFSLNKLQLMTACFDNKEELWNKYFPSFFGYHDRYNDLEEKDLEAAFGKDYSYYKGFVPHFHNESMPDPVIDTDECKAPLEKAVRYLDKIIEYTKENDIKLYITMVPYELNVEQQEGLKQEETQRYNWLENYVRELNAAGDDHVCFDYVFKHLGDIGLDYTGGSDISDGSSHLNYNGANKYSDYLGNTLINNYGRDLLPDHRGDVAYDSYLRHAEAIDQLVAENQD
ncbi:hypothetical protein [Butyrivibrio sp. INlla16]|uniref:hypothetical protein n=1 Tax=Butyrivibrio sp. INlla16 TaxID=1520807 RepID=UPI0008896AF1|nr:hypothetical protein [Butyrivibrio sp. INlla16]SDB28520.1 hypothetical protein SAMN02910263_01380 [Butyrivibrio sp. INlla16]